MKVDTQDQQTFLQRANNAFREGDFALAIELYKKAAKATPVLASSLQLNIGLAKARLALNTDLSEHTPNHQATINITDPRLTLTKPASLADYYFDKIVESGLFDATYYLSNYQNLLEDVDNLLQHYLEYGVDKSLNPSIGFDTAYYLQNHPDVAAAGVNPFLHYVCNGRNEGREAVPKPYTSKYEVAPVRYTPRLPTDVKPITKAVRTICFYLPQFHAIPENDKWWGKGFTEWTNVKPAIPQFEDHYQPHIPHNDIGYYNLLDRDTQAKQVELAKQYGIEGFCYYLYWFSGQRLLEQPLDNMLADPTLDFPFCVCWANENWSRRWDGLDQDLLMVQNYSDEDDINFISNIAKYLQDPRYITIDNKPLLLVYRPNLFPDMKATAKRWRNWCLNNGVGEIYLAYPQSFECVDPVEYDFDAAIEFPPNNSNPPQITDLVKPIVGDFQSKVYDWRAFVERSDAYIDPGYKLFRSATPSWDNTARKKNKGTVFHNSCPELFRKYLVNAFTETLYRRDNPDERLVFINAWNEWAEGAHLEPDQKYGYAWLQAVRDAHQIAGKKKRKVVIVSHDAHPHGAQVLCLNMAREFSTGLHFDVEIILLGEGVLLTKFQQYARVHNLNLEQQTPEAIEEFINDLANKGSDFAIINTTVSGILAPYLKKAGMRVISLVHELPKLLNNYGLTEHANLINQFSDKVVFPAKLVREGFESFIGTKVNQAVIKPQGLFQPSILRKGKTKRDCKEALIKEYNLPDKAKIIVNVAYADHRKGFDLFVDICCKIFKRIPDSYGIWVGHHDQILVEESLAKAEIEGYRERFILTNGYVDDPQIYYAGADVFALTSREDPFPSVVLESLDAETPVVAFKDCGGFEELLQRGCGLLAEKENILSFANQLFELLNNEISARELANKGKSIIDAELRFRHYLFSLLDAGGITLPKVSVVIPNYNYEKYIAQRIDSVLAQTYPIYELLVLDDCSKDNSDLVIRKYLETIDLPIRYIRNEVNSGSVFKQWAKGTQMAVGDYLWIAEADDLADSHFLERLVESYITNPSVVLAYSQSKQIDQDGNLLAENYLEYTKDIGNYWQDHYVITGVDEIKRALSIKNTIPNVSGTLFHRESLLSVLLELKDELAEYRVAGDWLVYVKLALRGKIAFHRDSLNYHRRHISSVTKVNNHMNEIIKVQNYCEAIVKLDDDVIEKRNCNNKALIEYFNTTQGQGN